MNKNFFIKNGTGELTIKTVYDYKTNVLKRELGQFKSIKVPTNKDTISGDELAEWLLEVSSPQEVDELVHMIQCVHKRGSQVKSLLQTIAAALLK